MNVRAMSIDTAGFFFTNRFHIALMPVFLTYFWNQVLKLPLPFEYYVMITLTTAAGYLYNMHTDAVEDSVNYVRKYQLFLPNTARTKWTVVALFLLAFLIALNAGWKFAVYGGIVNALFALYSSPLPIKWRGRFLRIKEVPFLKNVYCAICWSVALVLTPYVYLDLNAGNLAVLAIVLSFGMNYFVELMWDIRDMAGDAKAGFRTVPILIGEPAACRLMRLVHVFTCAVMLWAVWTGLLPQGFLIAALHLPAGLIYLEWYRRQVEKDWASHLYIMYAGSLLTAGMTWNLFLAGGGMN